MHGEPFEIEVELQFERVRWFVARLREWQRRPYDWEVECPELQKPDPHVRHVIAANADI